MRPSLLAPLLALSLLPTPVLAAPASSMPMHGDSMMGMEDMAGMIPQTGSYWDHIDMVNDQTIPVIINYQVTAKGARIFGSMAGAEKGVELFDNGVSLGGRQESLPNYVFVVNLPKPLDPNVEHRITVRGWDILDRPVMPHGSAAATGPDKTQLAVTFSAAQLQQQQRDLSTLQSGRPTSAPPTIATRVPSAGWTQPPAGSTDAAAATSRSWLLTLLFVVVLVVLVAAYVIIRKRLAKKG